MAYPYLTLTTFKARSFLSAIDVDFVENDTPGFTAARIAVRASWLHQRLRKRYGASLPFGEPTPEIILGWLTAMVSYDVLRKRGFNPQDPFAVMVKEDHDKALDEAREAADSQNGLFDIGSPEDGDSNVTTGGPLGYAETSPYVWSDIERNIGRAEDRAVRQLLGSDE